MYTISEVISLVRERLDLFDAARRLGINLKRNGSWYMAESFIEPSHKGNKNQVGFHKANGRFNYDHWTDFSVSGVPGGRDVIHLYQALVCGDPYLTDKNAFIKALNLCKKEAGIEEEISPKQKGKLENLMDKQKKWADNLKSAQFANVLKYNESRGIQRETLYKLNSGYDPAEKRDILFYFHKGVPVSYTGRYYDYTTNSDVPPSKNIPKEKFLSNKNSLTGENPVFEWETTGETDKDTLIIAEGHFDIKSVADANFPVASSFTANIPKNHLERYRELAKKYKHIAICLDSDKAGYTGAYKLASDFYEHGIYNVSIIDVAGKYGFMQKNKSDLNDYYKSQKDKGKTGEEIITELLKSDCKIPLFTFLSLKFLNENGTLKLSEIEKMLYKPVRKLDRYPVIEVCRDIQSFYFPEEGKNAPINKILENCSSKEEKKALENKKKDAIKFLEKLPSILQKKPPVHIICNEILEKHTLMYSGAHGFYEYDGHIWVYRPDEIIDHYISDALENFIDGPFIKSIENSLKAQCSRDFKLNEKSLIVFKNGTLHFKEKVIKENNKKLYKLETVFLPSKEEDMSSIMLEYDYNPEAKCSTWEKFIADIMENDPEKIQLLKEHIGYVFCPYNRANKLLFLKGEGSNGKSTLLEVLQEVYGPKNCSHIDLSQLKKDFEIAELEGKLVNLVFEEKADVRGAKDKIKTLTGNDTVHACKKYKDPFDFKPRVKFFIACNDFTPVNDPGFSIKRRFDFLGFNVKFEDNPSNGSRKKDPFLVDKLLKELPGIFNWALEGYKTLLENNLEFSYCSENEELTQEFMEISDPLYSFYEWLFYSYDTNKFLQDFRRSVEMYNFASYKDMYYLYKNIFAPDNGYLEMNSKTFSLRFSKIFIDLKLKDECEIWTRSKSRGERGLEIKKRLN